MQRYVSLPKPIDAHTRTFDHPVAGRVTTYEAFGGPGTPLVLVHNLGVGASSAQLRPVFDAFRHERPVIAVDLPGFGGSQRVVSRIDRAVYHDVLSDLFTKLVRQYGEPVDVVALSNGAELAAAATLRNEELVRSLVLIAPTGFSFKTSGPVDRVAANLRTARIKKLCLQPVVGKALYATLTSRPALKRELARSFVGAVDEELLEVSYAMAHQPEAWRAPMAQLSGALSDPEVRDRVYARLTVPVLVIFDGGGSTNYEALGGFLRAEPSWSAERVRPSRDMPHFECPDETFQLMRRFFSGLDSIFMADVPSGLFLRS
ncbi:MAG: alpha/beta hydrolase [Polyangiaceae bacterium]|nr:alpha/beta hydrolase [Polyangiaceae bacterium]